MVKAKPKGVKAKRGLWRLALGLGDPKLVGVGGGLVALLAIGIGANLMQASGIDASPHRLSAASPHLRVVGTRPRDFQSVSLRRF